MLIGVRRAAWPHRAGQQDGRISNVGVGLLFQIETQPYILINRKAASAARAGSEDSYRPDRERHSDHSMGARSREHRDSRSPEPRRYPANRNAKPSARGISHRDPLAVRRIAGRTSLRLIHLRHDRHCGHARGECEGQGENQKNLFHDRSPW